MSQSTGTMGDYTLGEASVDIDTKYYTFIRKDVTTGKVVTCGDGERMAGIQQNKPKAGEGVSVRTQGTSKLVVDGTQGGGIGIGAKLKSDGSGRGIVTTSDGDEIGAIAQEASTAADDVIEVALVNRQA